MMQNCSHKEIAPAPQTDSRDASVTVLGTGLLASAFKRHFKAETAICVFARGVSNSAETSTAEFEREARLLNEALTSFPRLTYFSSCALINPNGDDTPYFAHKRNMERVVLGASADNLVLRLPQVVGKTDNPHTLTNFLSNRISQGEPFSVWSRAERNLIDADDIARIATSIVNESPVDRVISLASRRSLSMLEIVALFERVIGKTAIYTVQDRGNPLPIENSLCLRVAEKLGIDLGETYPERIIRKHYGR